MPLPWLALCVLTGIPLVLLLVHLTGGSRVRTLAASDLEGLQEVVLDDSVALGVGSDGPELVWVMEQNLARRPLRGQLRAVEVLPDGLRLRWEDPALAPRAIRVPESQRQEWRRRLEALDGA